MEKGTGLVSQDAWGDFDLVVELGAGQEFEGGAEGAALRVVGAVDEPGDAGLDDCAGAHGARLEGYV